MDSNSRILVAGSNGMVGSAIVRNLQNKGYGNIIRGTRLSVDFTDQESTDTFFRLKKPEYVFLTAARCGGIFDNINYPVEYLLTNLKIQNNIIESSYRWNVKKLMFFASSCVFPKESLQPIKEEYLLTGPLEPTNESYSIAKIAGIKLCEAYRKQYGCNFISVNPCNVYGPGDKFDPLKGHVMSSLIYKIWKAHNENQSEVICFGDGSPEREFIHVDDLADASIFLMDIYDEPDMINIGTGVDYTIKSLAETIKEMVGYIGDLIWDTTKPNGMMKKVLDVSKLKSLGWESKIDLNGGIASVLNYLEKNP
jgi:GDP-L-fucose synthase